MDPNSFFSPGFCFSLCPRRRFYALLAALLIVLLALSLPTPGVGQAQIVEFDVENDFGKAITFTVKMKTEVPVQSAQIALQKQGETGTFTAPVEIGPQGTLKYRYDFKSLEPGQLPPRPFSKITYRFLITLENGEEFTSQEFTFDYVDNRFSWEQKEGGMIRVHWYQGDDIYAQDILDAAQRGLEKAQELLPLEIKNEIHFYAYASSAEMQAALMAGQDWVAGQTAPDLGVSVVSLPAGRPETRLEINRQIPHELMHLLLYQYIERGYSNLPTWLNEGLASMNELNPNPDYQTILEHAVRNDSLIEISSLCGNFPVDISGALLAYAEADSFTRFVYQQFGASSLEKLVKNYADGMDCSRGVETALGVSLEQLESQWLEESFRVNEFSKAFSELLPWFVLFFILIAVPLWLSFGGLRKTRTRMGEVRI